MDTLQSHYARLLGLDDSWWVESVDLRIEDQRVEIRLSNVGSGVICPECGGASGVANHADKRRWRRLDTMQFTTELVARLPRNRCAEHGVKTIVPPWAGKHFRFTLLFDAFAVDVLQAYRTVKVAAALLGLSWYAVPTIMGRAFARGLERRESRPIKHIGIDQKSFGRRKDYITDLEGSRVLNVVPERTQAAAESVLATLTGEQRQQVCAVASDMLPSYAQAVATQMPNAEPVHDKFHVAKHLGEAVDQVRRAENKAFQAHDDDRLKGSRQLWLLQLGKPLSRAAMSLRRYQEARLEASESLGNHRSFFLVLAACLFDERLSLLQAVVCPVREMQTAAGDQGGEDAHASSAQPPDRLPLADHERHDRRLQQRLPGPEVSGTRLPLLRQLPDSNPVLLRKVRSRATATLLMKCRKNKLLYKTACKTSAFGGPPDCTILLVDV